MIGSHNSYDSVESITRDLDSSNSLLSLNIVVQRYRAFLDQSGGINAAQIETLLQEKILELKERFSSELLRHNSLEELEILTIDVKRIIGFTRPVSSFADEMYFQLIDRFCEVLGPIISQKYYDSVFEDPYKLQKAIQEVLEQKGIYYKLDQTDLDNLLSLLPEWPVKNIIQKTFENLSAEESLQILNRLGIKPNSYIEIFEIITQFNLSQEFYYDNSEKINNLLFQKRSETVANRIFDFYERLMVLMEDNQKDNIIIEIHEILRGNKSYSDIIGILVREYNLEPDDIQDKIIEIANCLEIIIYPSK